MRDLTKYYEQGRKVITENRELTAEELNKIKEYYDRKLAMSGSHYEALWDVILITFFVGAAVGYKTKKK